MRLCSVFLDCFSPGGLAAAGLFSVLRTSTVGAIVAATDGQAERGIGRPIIGSEARAEASGRMVASIVLMLVGVVLSATIW